MNEDRAVATDSAPVDASAAALSCAQIYGGIQQVETDVTLTGLSGFLYSQPCQSSKGGDIHYLSICGSGLLSRFCVADVVGHGSEVEVVSDEAHRLLRRAMNWTDHRRVLTTLNQQLVDRGLQSLTTIAMCTYFPVTKRLTYSYAGHLPAWHFSYATKQWRQLGMNSRRQAEFPRDLPLAVDTMTRFSRSSTRVHPGDMIALTTDGVTDVLDTESRRFGNKGLERALNSANELNPRSVVSHVLEQLLAHSNQESPRHDDVTVLVLKIEPFSVFSSIRTFLRNRLPGSRIR